MSKHEFTHIQSGGYFRKRLVLGSARKAGLSVFHRYCKNPACASGLEHLERREAKGEQKLDYSDSDSRYLA